MQNNYVLFFTILSLTVAVSWLFTGWIARNASKLGLVQAPNYRSSHVNTTPSGGGVAVVLTVTASGIWLSWENPMLCVVLALSAILAVVGIWDDIAPLPAHMRLVVQFAVCCVLLYSYTPLPFINVPTLPYMTLAAERYLEGGLLMSLLVIVGVWWLNLFNFMDGIDGIAASQGIFMFVAAGLLGLWTNKQVINYPEWLCMMVLAAAVFGFLLRNWSPASIFMGDVGSMYIAFMIFALALASIKGGWLSYSSWLILAALFVSDATVTLLRRAAAGQSWYEAHRTHAYQHLSRRWQSHRRVVILAIAINVFWLVPLAFSSLVWSQWSAAWVILAYGPLLVGVYGIGAGKAAFLNSEHTG